MFYNKNNNLLAWFLMFVVIRASLLITNPSFFQYQYYVEENSVFYNIYQWLGYSYFFSFKINPEYYAGIGPNITAIVYDISALLFRHGFYTIRILSILIASVGFIFLIKCLNILFPQKNLVIILFLWIFLPYQILYNYYFLYGNHGESTTLLFIVLYLCLKLFYSKGNKLKIAILIMILTFFSLFFNMINTFIFVFLSGIIIFFQPQKQYKLSLVLLILFLLTAVYFKSPDIINVKILISYLGYSDNVFSSVYYYLYKLILNYFFYLPLVSVNTPFIFQKNFTPPNIVVFHSALFLFYILYFITIKNEINHLRKKIMMIFFYSFIISLSIVLMFQPIEMYMPLPNLINKKIEYVFWDKFRYYLYPITFFFFLLSYILAKNIIYLKVFNKKINFLSILSIIFIISTIYSICRNPLANEKRYTERSKLMAINCLERYHSYNKYKFDKISYINNRIKAYLKDHNKNLYLHSVIYDDFIKKEVLKEKIKLMEYFIQNYKNKTDFILIKEYLNFLFDNYSENFSPEFFKLYIYKKYFSDLLFLYIGYNSYFANVSYPLFKNSSAKELNTMFQFYNKVYNSYYRLKYYPAFQKNYIISLKKSIYQKEKIYNYTLISESVDKILNECFY